MSALFAPSQPAAQPIAAPKPPAPMPDTTSAAALEAKRRVQTDIMGRAGRSSTILTAPKDRAADYTSTTLGAGNV